MGGQKVLIVRILHITHDDAAADDQYVVLNIRVQEHTVHNLTGETNRVIKFNLLSRSDSHLFDILSLLLVLLRLIASHDRRCVRHCRLLLLCNVHHPFKF